MRLKKDAISKLKVHVVLWCIAVFMLFIGIMNLQGSAALRDYRCLDGEIVNLEETKVLQKPLYVTRYNYKIIWHDNDVRYEKSVHEAIDCPDEGKTKVWVNPDNTDAVLGDSKSAKVSGYIDLGIAMITFVLGIVFAPRGNKKKKMNVDQMETMYYMAVVTAVLMVFGDLLMLFYYRSLSGSAGHVTTVCWDLSVVFTIILVLSIVTIVKLKKELK